MAKRKYSAKRSRNMEPAVQTLTFTGLTVSGLGGRVDHLDLSQIASVVNRRFYRQGINWAVAGFKFTATGGSGSIQINKLPNTWVMANAWEKSMRAWMKMTREAMEETSVRPRFLDFKIYADSTHHAAGYAANLLPQSGTNTNFQAGEWEASEVYTPNGPNFPGNTTNFELIATGANFPGVGASGLDAVSLIEGYAASRGLPNIADPNTPDDALDADGSTPENWLAAMFNEGTDRDSEVIEDLITKNNVSPYPFENGPIVGGGTYTDTMYPGGANQGTGLQVHDVELVTGTTIGGTTRIKGGNFPCGLIQIVTVNTSEAAMNFTLQIDLVPGHHRGYLCESMTEM
jgi:hypothetical protein